VTGDYRVAVPGDKVQRNGIELHGVGPGGTGAVEFVDVPKSEHRAESQQKSQEDQTHQIPVPGKAQQAARKLILHQKGCH
jgi:hypothetical protein